MSLINCQCLYGLSKCHTIRRRRSDDQVVNDSSLLYYVIVRYLLANDPPQSVLSLSLIFVLRRVQKFDQVSVMGTTSASMWNVGRARTKRSFGNRSSKNFPSRSISCGGIADWYFILIHSTALCDFRSAASVTASSVMFGSRWSWKRLRDRQ